MRFSLLTWNPPPVALPTSMSLCRAFINTNARCSVSVKGGCLFHSTAMSQGCWSRGAMWWNKQEPSGSICKTGRGERKLDRLSLWLLAVYQSPEVQPSCASLTSSVMRFHLSVAVPIIWFHLILCHSPCSLRRPMLQLFPLCQGSWWWRLVYLNLGHFLMREPCGSRALPGDRRGEGAQAQHAVLLESPTSEAISWRAVTEGGRSVNGCDICGTLAPPLPLLPFFSPTAPIYTYTSLYNIILAPWNAHLHPGSAWRQPSQCLSWKAFYDLECYTSQQFFFKPVFSKYTFLISQQRGGCIKRELLQNDLVKN